MRGKKLKRDVIINLAFAVVKTIALMWVIRQAGEVLLPATLGLFLLARRLASTGANLLHLGIPQTILRYVAIHNAERTVKRHYVSQGLLVWVGLTVICVPILYGLQDWLTHWFFPDAIDGGSLVFWTGILMLATITGFIAYSTAIAGRWMIRANLIELMNTSGFVLLILFWNTANRTPVSIIRLQALCMLLLSLGVILLVVFSSSETRWPEGEERHTIHSNFLHYGLARAPLTFLDMATLLIGPWLLRGDIEEAGYLIIALTLVRAIQAGLMPITQVASVVTASFLKNRNDQTIAEGIRLLFGTILYTTVIALAVLVPWRHTILLLWLGDQELVSGVSKYFSVLLWGMLPFTIFHGLKGVIETRWTRPLNLYTLVVGVVAMLSSFHLTVGSCGVEAAIRLSMLAMFWLVGGMTILWVVGYLRPFNYWGLPQLAVITAIVTVGNLWAVAESSFLTLVIPVALLFLVLVLLRTILSSAFIRDLCHFLGLSPKSV
jgi:O-antigen/teichoic acid export membrane protein